MKPILFLLCVGLLSGCAAGRLTPVRGPLSMRTPPPVFGIKTGYDAEIRATLDGGERCSGYWLAVVEPDPTTRLMSAEWDVVYGQGFFEASVHGKSGIARADLTCTKNSKVTVEFDSTKGVAKDGNGNVYRVTF